MRRQKKKKKKKKKNVGEVALASLYCADTPNKTVSPRP